MTEDRWADKDEVSNENYHRRDGGEQNPVATERICNALARIHRYPATTGVAEERH